MLKLVVDFSFFFFSLHVLSLFRRRGKRNQICTEKQTNKQTNKRRWAITVCWYYIFSSDSCGKGKTRKHFVTLLQEQWTFVCGALPFLRKAVVTQARLYFTMMEVSNNLWTALASSFFFPNNNIISLSLAFFFSRPLSYRGGPRDLY